MALVTKITFQSKDARAPHKPAECHATIATANSGEKYLQLDTFGSADREQPNKVSQSLQFSRASAEQLLHLLRQTFPDLK